MADEGVYALDARSGRLEVHRRARSMLCDGVELDTAISPLLPRRRGSARPSFESAQGSVAAPVAPGVIDEATSLIPKPGPPSVYDSVRRADRCTLLTSDDGSELYEACIAAVLWWDGARWCCPPWDRPRVASLSEAQLAAEGLIEPRAIAADVRAGLVLINAVQGPCRPAGSLVADDVLMPLLEAFARATTR